MAGACLLHSRGSIPEGVGSYCIANLGGSVCIVEAHSDSGCPPSSDQVCMYYISMFIIRKTGYFYKTDSGISTAGKYRGIFRNEISLNLEKRQYCPRY